MYGEGATEKNDVSPMAFCEETVRKEHQFQYEAWGIISQLMFHGD